MEKAPDYERNIHDIAKAIKFEKDNKKATTFLIGAGFSVSAGVPSASEFVKNFEKEDKYAYERALQKCHGKMLYNACMAELSIANRRQRIMEWVSKAKINWAHIALACMMKAGYVDRVLTINFDNLLIRACALLDFFPAVYDMTAQKVPIAYDDLPEHSIFYLHGQSTGFRLMNTEPELEDHAPELRSCFNFSSGGRTWVVVGYSGANDPVFEDHIACIPTFTHGLHWTYYIPNGLESEVFKELFGSKKDAFAIPIQDADQFMCDLALELGCFPPDFVGKPFTYLDNHLSYLTPYPIGDNNSSLPVPETTHEMIQRAIEQIEKSEALKQNMTALLMGREYSGVISLFNAASDSIKPDLRELVAWAYVSQGNELARQAKMMIGEKATKLLEQAGDMYQEALKIQPNHVEALINFGNIYSDQIPYKTGEEADNLFSQATKKYQQAIVIEPNSFEAFYNWGNLLVYRAQKTFGIFENDFFKQAGEKYEQALRINPDDYETYFNWGLALTKQALLESDQDADISFQLANEKYENAFRLQPNQFQNLYYWSNNLIAQARKKKGKMAYSLLQSAIKNLKLAINIKPYDYETYRSWGHALFYQAQLTTGAKAELLFHQASEKLSLAHDIRPDDYITLIIWADLFRFQVRTKSNIEEGDLLEQASKKSLMAENLNSGSGSYNLACIAARRGNVDECRQWLEKCIEYKTLPTQSELQQDKDLDTVQKELWFTELVEKADDDMKI